MLGRSAGKAWTFRTIATIHSFFSALGTTTCEPRAFISDLPFRLAELAWARWAIVTDKAHPSALFTAPRIRIEQHILCLSIRKTKLT